jgi:TonB family protein
MEKKKQEAGEWVYDNRKPVFITIIIYLIIAIIFLSARIVIDRRVKVSELNVEFADLAELEKQQQEAEELNRALNEAKEAAARRNTGGGDWSDVRNVVSNDNVEQLYDNDRQVQAQLRASRDMYEAGLREQQAAFEQQEAAAIRSAESSSQGATTGTDVKVKGSVTVSFSLADPIRSSSGLTVPAYRCEAGGSVVVAITVNQNGEVMEASVVKAESSADACMTSTALDAAYSSRFNVDGEAPPRHTGTITYMFIPQ